MGQYYQIIILAEQPIRATGEPTAEELIESTEIIRLALRPHTVQIEL